MCVTTLLFESIHRSLHRLTIDNIIIRFSTLWVIFAGQSTKQADDYKYNLGLSHGNQAHEYQPTMLKITHTQAIQVFIKQLKYC